LLSVVEISVCARRRDNRARFAAPGEHSAAQGGGAALKVGPGFGLAALARVRKRSV